MTLKLLVWDIVSPLRHRGLWRYDVVNNLRTMMYFGMMQADQRCSISISELIYSLFSRTYYQFIRQISNSSSFYKQYIGYEPFLLFSVYFQMKQYLHNSKKDSSCIVMQLKWIFSNGFDATNRILFTFISKIYFLLLHTVSETFCDYYVINISNFIVT